MVALVGVDRINIKQNSQLKCLWKNKCIYHQGLSQEYERKEESKEKIKPQYNTLEIQE